MFYRHSLQLFVLIIFITACSSNEQTVNNPQEMANQEIKEKEFVRLQETEVKEILQLNINTIFETLVKLGEENGWGSGNPSDFNIIKPKMTSLTTEEFLNNTLKSLTREYYCECDIQFKPSVSYDIRFEYEQNKKDEITIKALEAATEMGNIGLMWEFVLVKEDSIWKLHKWDIESLEGKDLNLTREEAKKILARYGETPEFVKEYESKETAGKAFLFNLLDSYGERLVAISTKDTSLVYDFEDNNTIGTVEQTNEESTQLEKDQTNQLEDKKDEPSINASTKQEFIAILTQTETKERKNEYQSDYQMSEDYGYNYQLWDGILNDIYAVLKIQLSKSEMSNLRNEQLRWIETRDATAQARYDEEGGGSMSVMVKVETLFNLTKERCYELVNKYMK